MARFRMDNTEGYGPEDLAHLNQAIEYVIESCQLADKSEIDHAMAKVQECFDHGLRDWDLIEAASPP